MSDESNQALELLASGRFDEGRGLALSAIQRNSSDWHAHYALGQYFRFIQDFPQACLALTRARELLPDDTTVLLALAISRQLNGEYEASIEAVKAAIEIDPDYAVAYNTLGMTQKHMGNYEDAARSYDQGVEALARGIAKSMHNADNSPRLPHFSADLSLNYTLSGAMYLGALASVDRIALPPGELAARDERTREYQGWYWQDHVDAEGKLTRAFLPNFFNTFHASLLADKLYAFLIGNRSTVLRLLGRMDEADRHVREAEEAERNRDDMRRLLGWVEQAVK